MVDLTLAPCSGQYGQPLLLEGGLAIWSIDLTTMPVAEALGWLSVEEYTRAESFHHEKDRTHYLAAHIALREVIALCFDRAPTDQRFAKDAYGKWRMEGASDWDFSMSYAGAVGLIAIARNCQIGVDIEMRREMDDVADLAAFAFAAEEKAALSCLAPEEASIAFLRGWTRKEACLKALGTGLHSPPADFHTGIAPLRSRVRGPFVGDMEVQSFDVGEAFVAAWATLRSRQ